MWNRLGTPSRLPNGQSLKFWFIAQDEKKTDHQQIPTELVNKWLQYEPKKFCRRAAESGRLLRAANRRLPTPSGNGGERQTPVIFTPRAVLDPMLQTMMDPGTSLPVIPLHESQITAARLKVNNWSNGVMPIYQHCKKLSLTVRVKTKLLSYSIYSPWS